MSPIAVTLTDLYLSIAALTGLAILHMSLTGDDALTRRFVFGVRVTMLLFAGRALVALTGGAGFRFLVMLAAGLIPIAVLILTEGLLRRHAPRGVKILAGGGTVVFTVLAFLPSGWIDPARLWGLFAFQVSVFALCGWLVVTRDKAKLSWTENTAVVRLALSLVLFIPLIAVDFATVAIGVPVQLSAIGVLALCWLALTLGNDTEGQRASITALCVAFALALAAGGLISVTTASGRDGMIIATAIALGAILLVMIFIDARRQQAAQQSLTILQHLAKGPIDDPMTFLRGLRNFPRVEGAVIIEQEDLRDLNVPILAKAFERTPVLRRSGPKPNQAEEAEHIDHLFERFGASHILQVRDEPIQLVALAMPALAASPNAELEVDVVQRMAALIGDRKRDQ